MQIIEHSVSTVFDTQLNADIRTVSFNIINNQMIVNI